MKKINVPPLGKLAKIADALLVPFMYLVSGTIREAPQGGHRWNNIRLRPADIGHLSRDKMVHCKGVATRFSSRFLFLYHIPVLGGWRDYVVLVPELRGTEWHVGWIIGDAIGVSQIELFGPVRMLIGPGDVSFFGISAESHEQITIKEIGRGRIGESGPGSKIRLL